MNQYREVEEQMSIKDIIESHQMFIRRSRKTAKLSMEFIVITLLPFFKKVRSPPYRCFVVPLVFFSVPMKSTSRLIEANIYGANFLSSNVISYLPPFTVGC